MRCFTKPVVYDRLIFLLHATPFSWRLQATLFDKFQNLIFSENKKTFNDIDQFMGTIEGSQTRVVQKVYNKFRKVYKK